MTKVSRRLSYRKSGAALIEFTLVFPLFLGIVFTILDTSVVIYDLALLTNASRETARASIVSADPTQHNVAYYWTTTKTYCMGHMISLGSGGSNNCTLFSVIGEQATPVPGNPITVAVTYQYQSLISNVVPNIPFFSWTMPTLGAKATMRYE